jgi:hypothetical protein
VKKYLNLSGDISPDFIRRGLKISNFVSLCQEVMVDGNLLMEYSFKGKK